MLSKQSESAAFKRSPPAEICDVAKSKENAAAVSDSEESQPLSRRRYLSCFSAGKIKKKKCCLTCVRENRAGSDSFIYPRDDFNPSRGKVMEGGNIGLCKNKLPL